MNNKSLLIICSSIILGFIILSITLFISLNNITKVTYESSNRYQFLTYGSNLIVIDYKTKSYWKKYINPEIAPNEWTRENLDFLSKNK